VANSLPSNSIVLGIVVPAYNSARHLPKLLKSITNATRQQFECVVVNDGSTDNTIEVFNEEVGCDSRFKLLSIKNGGVAAARNAGYSLVSDHVTHVTFMDADDAYVVGGLDALLDHLLSRPDIRVVHGLGTFDNEESGVDTSGQYETFGMDRVSHKWGFPYALPKSCDTTLASIILKSTMFPPGLVLFERSIITDIGLFNTSPMIHHADDWHFMIRLAIAGPIAFLPKSVLLYRRHESNAGAASTIPIACANVWRLIFWNRDNSALTQIELFFAWKAKQLIDLWSRVQIYVRFRDFLSLQKLAIGLSTCTLRWFIGSPSKRLEALNKLE
jgi:glycosyltransferase involved in cell wall biosynthesis